METKTKSVLNESYAGKALEDVATALTAAGYKIRVVPAGVPVMLTENRDLGRATIEVANGKVTFITIG
jgi:hypothetical protein